MWFAGLAYQKLARTSQREPILVESWPTTRTFQTNNEDLEMTSDPIIFLVWVIRSCPQAILASAEIAQRKNNSTETFVDKIRATSTTNRDIR